MNTINTITPIKGTDGRYHYIYLITNDINGKYYKGVHSTFDLHDGYLGSGTNLKRAKLKYGEEHFTLTIIKFFNSRDDALRGEFEYITENDIKSNNCYNICHGGEQIGIGKVSAIDKNGNYLQVDADDKRLLNKEIFGATKGKVVVKDCNGNCMQVDINDKRYLSGELVPINAGKCIMQDSNGNIFRVDITDKRITTGELKSISCNKVSVKDKNGNHYVVNINDERYLSGELIPINCGKVIVKDDFGNIFQVDKTDERYLTGELKSLFANDILVKDKDNNHFRVSKTDERYLSGELISIHKGYCNAKDKNGKIFRADINDERFKTGEIISALKGYVCRRNKITGETKLVHKDEPEYTDDNWISPFSDGICVIERTTRKITYVFSKNDPKILSGEYVISRNLCSVHKIINNKKVTKRIFYEELKEHLSDGWNVNSLNTIIYFNDNEDNIISIKRVNVLDVSNYIMKGWMCPNMTNDIVVYKDNKYKYVLRKDFLKYKDNGWIRIKLTRDEEFNKINSKR